MVSSVRGDDGSDKDMQYQTLFMRSSEEGGEYELVFFRKLDDEFNKVVKFYKGKVDEVVNEADELSRQMNALIALRIKVEKPHLVGAGRDPFAASHRTPSSPTFVHSISSKRHGKYNCSTLSAYPNQIK